MTGIIHIHPKTVAIIKKAFSGDYPLVTTSNERGSHINFQFDCEANCIPLVSSSGHGHASLERVHYQSGRFALGSKQFSLIYLIEKCENLRNTLSKSSDDAAEEMIKSALNEAFNKEEVKV